MTPEEEAALADVARTAKQLETIETLGDETDWEQWGGNLYRELAFKLRRGNEAFGETFESFASQKIPYIANVFLPQIAKQAGEIAGTVGTIAGKGKDRYDDYIEEFVETRDAIAPQPLVNAIAAARGFVRNTDKMRGFVLDKDPFQQIEAGEGETVFNNAHVLNGDMHDIEFNGDMPRLRSTGDTAFSGKESSEIGALHSPGPKVVVSGGADSAVPAPGPKEGPGPSLYEEYETAIAGDQTLGTLSADLAASRALYGGVTAQRLTGMLEQDAYRRRASAASLIEAATVPTVQDNIGNLARIPEAVSSDLRGNVALLQQGSPTPIAPGIQGGINAQATQTNRVMNQTDAALGGAQRSAAELVGTQKNLRSQLQDIIYTRLLRERGQ